MKSYETEPQASSDAVDKPLVDDQYSEEEDAEMHAAEESQSVLGSTSTMAHDTGESALTVTSPIEEDDEPAERPRKLRFTPPSREQLITWAPYWAIILLGTILRFWGLGDKPLHHDESLHAYFSLQLMHNMENWASCFNPNVSCYHYDPLLHGPFQFHAIAFVYQISQWLNAPDHGINTTTVRIAAATLGSLIVVLPYFVRDYLGRWGSILACFLLAVSPSMVYFSRFAREDIYMASFTMLLVVSVARYVRDRKMRWIVLAALAFALSYATKEATFLTVAVFGSFMGALLVWELGLRLKLRPQPEGKPTPWYMPHTTAAPIFLLAYFVVAGLAAKAFFAWLKALSIYVTDPKNTTASNLYVQGLKDKTVAIVPWIGILLGIYVLSILGREMFGSLPLPGRRGLARRIDPERQPLLDTIFTMPWTHWFFALLAGWAVFLVLFTVLFTNIKNGIGDGIWEGLYYWIQQQQVARGGQPWYYYLMLIPLYEQIGVIFGIVGLVRSILRPTRFRLFLAYWFVGNLFIYSWAAEKMPWLMIHITMPMLLLAAVGLESAVVTCIDMAKGWLGKSAPAERIAPVAPVENEDEEHPVIVLLDAEGDEGKLVPTFRPQPRRRVGLLNGAAAVIGFVLAILLLLPTIHNMYEVSYVHAADGPHEMMVYVQTTTDVNTVMAKIDALDQKLYGGKRLLPIGLMNDATWPFAWYVRDYSNVCFNYPDGCASTAKTYPVIIAGGDNLYNAASQYASANGSYLFHQYHMRTWWDEGYKPPPCVPTKTNNCDGEATYGGVGPWLWLSYGDNPPPNATFNFSLAAQHIWQWWWDRRAIGDTGGTYDMGLFIQKNLGETP